MAPIASQKKNKKQKTINMDEPNKRNQHGPYPDEPLFYSRRCVAVVLGAVLESGTLPRWLEWISSMIRG